MGEVAAECFRNRRMILLLVQVNLFRASLRSQQVNSAICSRTAVMLISLCCRLIVNFAVAKFQPQVLECCTQLVVMHRKEDQRPSKSNLLTMLLRRCETPLTETKAVTLVLHLRVCMVTATVPL